MQKAFMALEKAIEGHHAAPATKADARYKLKARLEHALVVPVLGGCWQHGRKLIA
jgi:hypothetical protein